MRNRIALALLLAAPLAWAVDTEPPQLGHEIAREASERQRIRITCTIYDESAIFEPRLYYRRAGTNDYLVMSLASSGDIYVATIPEEIVKADLEYYLEAFDEHGNGPSRHGRPDNPHRIKIKLATPNEAATQVVLLRAPEDALPPKDSIELGTDGPGEPIRAPFWLSIGLGASGVLTGALAIFNFVKYSQAATNRDISPDDSTRSTYSKEASSAMTLGIVASVGAAALLSGGVYFFLEDSTATQE